MKGKKGHKRVEENRRSNRTKCILAEKWAQPGACVHIKDCGSFPAQYCRIYVAEMGNMDLKKCVSIVKSWWKGFSKESI